MRLIHSRQIVALELWSDLLGCHVGVRADVLRGMPVGIPAWQAKRLLHGALDKVHHLRRRPLVCAEEVIANMRKMRTGNI
jgi:hypothetical protein